MDLDEALARLADEPDCELDPAELAFLLARDEYPGLDIDASLAEVQAMAHEARPYVRGSLEGRVHGLCRYLFHDMGFHGDSRDYYDPRNSYLNEVLDRRTGIPITLSVVTMAVGRRVGMDIVGIGLPGHFVVKACSGCGEVLFDPFRGGRRLTSQLCERLVFQVTGMEFCATPDRMRAVSVGQLLQRMLTNLKAIYARTGELGRAARVLQRLRQLCPAEPEYLRDLGLNLLCSGQTGKAIDHLTEYLSCAPHDEQNVQQVLDRARGELARWN
jgi:regulator of sirC expression with transglutaminase-like and TPR domain